MSEACLLLTQFFAALPRFSSTFNDTDIPRNGIYVVFERGETAHATDRIVRIGTHTGYSQLPSRLHQHFTQENKDRSIFRKNIGRAALHRDNNPLLHYWDLDLTSRQNREQYASSVLQEQQATIEHAVTCYIQEYLSFTVIPIELVLDRLALESRLIATVAACDTCKPSLGWIGNFSPNQKIRTYGLWLVNGLFHQPLTRFEAEELYCKWL